MFATMTLDSVLATLSRPTDTVTIGFNNAVKLIAESNGRLTWLDAGDSWARVCLARKGSEYPPLTC
tara:strand:+ start:38415 stop:38612 length:198 start_codon:yes stop_codon:yes gene_type:complete